MKGNLWDIMCEFSKEKWPQHIQEHSVLHSTDMPHSVTAINISKSLQKNR